MPVDEETCEALAASVLSAGDRTVSVPPITDELPAFDLADAYRVAAIVMKWRVARDERPIGWKIGFTNYTIWDEYGVHAPIWGPMYEFTAAAVDLSGGPHTWPVRRLVEPRIEPEIAFRFRAAPHAGMDDAAILSCVDAVAHGFEIVQSIFPGWRFKAADTVAAFALHGAYRHGPLVSLDAEGRAGWLEMLSAFEIVLSCNGDRLDRGVAANVLGAGPLTALRHFANSIPDYSPDWAIRAGDLVTTGTVTRAFPVSPGERWSTEIQGLPLPGMDVVLT